MMHAYVHVPFHVLKHLTCHYMCPHPEPRRCEDCGCEHGTMMQRACESCAGVPQLLLVLAHCQYRYAVWYIGRSSPHVLFMCWKKTCGMRTFIVHFVWDKHPSVKSQCASALRLMDCLDKLMLLNRGGSVEASELHETIKKYLDQFLQTYDAEEHWMPKHHCALHLAEFLKRHKCLLSCWVHERKHRLVKRFGNNVLNFTQGFEKSILQDIIHVQLRELETESFELGTCLINEKKAKDSQIGWLREFTGPGDVFISWVASTPIAPGWCLCLDCFDAVAPHSWSDVQSQ